MEVESDEREAQLVKYLYTVLRCQIIPMNIMDLRSLIKETPKKMRLYQYVQESYPGNQLLLFLQKYPNTFVVNPDKTVVLAEGNDFTLAFAQPNVNENVTLSTEHDEVDGRDNAEYISNSSESDDSEDEDSSDQENCSSSIPDSSIHNSLTSDSDVSSLSPKSSTNIPK